MKTHEMHGTPEYMTWRGMRQRCRDENHVAYARYGGRGISVCPEWDNSFDQFYKDMGPRPPGTSIERLDNNGNYEPGNCIWAAISKQNRNRRSNRIIEVGGVSKSAVEWSEFTGISDATIRKRLEMGWTADQAVGFEDGPTRDTYEKPGPVGNQLTFSGKTQSVAEWAKEVGLKKHTLLKRLREGWSVEDAFSVKDGRSGTWGDKRRNSYTHNGETRTISQWCVFLQINYNTVMQRVQRGKSIAKALGLCQC